MDLGLPYSLLDWNPAQHRDPPQSQGCRNGQKAWLHSCQRLNSGPHDGTANTFKTAEPSLQLRYTVRDRRGMGGSVQLRKGIGTKA